MSRLPPAPKGSRRPRALPFGALLLGLAAVVGLALTVPPHRLPAFGWNAGGAGGAAAPAPSASPRPPLAIRPVALTLRAEGVAEWAMVDHRTGKVSGSAGLTRTNNTASLVKAWIAADYLRRHAEAGTRPDRSRLDEVSRMIRDSDNDAALRLYAALGNRASSERMMRRCRLTDGAPNGDWSVVTLSARDIARLGACIADGTAAGRTWTRWLLGEMRSVRGVGDFGVRDAFPAAQRQRIGIKNGWVVRDETGLYEVNCLAVGDGWSVGVVTRYPARLGHTYGADLCEQVGRALRRT